MVAYSPVYTLATKSTDADTVDFVAGFGDKSATTWIRQLVAVDIVANSVDFVACVHRAYSQRSSWPEESSFSFISAMGNRM